MRATGRPGLLVVGLAVVVVVAVVWLLDPWSGAPPQQVTTDEIGELTSEAIEAPPPASEEGPTTAEETGERVAVPASLAPAGTPSAQDLWGRVVSITDGSPIAGAEIVLQHRDADEFWNLDLDYGKRIDELDRTKSDAEGRFAFGVARAREHRLHVSAPDYAAATVLHCTGGSEVLVELSRGASIEGLVVCEGAGVPGADIRVAVRGASVELARAKADRNGAFRITGLPPAQVYVQTHSPMHDEKWTRLTLEGGRTHEIEIVIVIGKTLHGRVIDATSRQPIAHAELSASWTFKRSVRSAADGTFALGGIGDENFVEVHVRAEGYATASRNLASALDEEVEFALLRGGEVTGRFVDAGGAPPTAIYAAVGASFMAGPGVVSTDWIRAHVRESGVFVALGLRPDQHYWLYVRGRAYGTRVYALPRQLEPNERVDVGDVVLRAAGGIEGRVVDDSGNPVAGVEVSVRGVNADAQSWLEKAYKPIEVSQFQTRDVETDPLGRFRLTNLAAGTYQVLVRPRGRPRPVSRDVEVSADSITEGVELILPVGHTIAGTLQRADGRALGDETASLRLTAWRQGGRSIKANIGSDGRFTFTGLDEGDHIVSLPGAPKGWSLRPVRGVAAGTEDLQLQLEPASFVSGQVLDQAGQPIKARIYVRYANRATSGSPMSSTDDEGRFRVEVPPDFRGLIGAMHPTQMLLQAHQGDVIAGQQDIELRFN